MSRILYDGTLFADYFQFFLCDENNSQLPEDYSEESIRQRLIMAPQAAIVHAARNADVDVLVEWHDERPAPELAAFDHVVEAGFFTDSGRLMLAGLMDYTETSDRLQVPVGPVGLRVSMSGFETIDQTGLEGQDRYLLQLWPAKEIVGVQVLKAWPGL